MSRKPMSLSFSSAAAVFLGSSKERYSSSEIGGELRGGGETGSGRLISEEKAAGFFQAVWATASEPDPTTRGGRAMKEGLMWGFWS
jgi:hypothetical protein